MTTPAIGVRGLTLRLGGKTILQSVDFTLHPGEYISIIGPNGAGKTSLVKCVCGIVPHQAGHVEIMGRDAVAMTAKERARRVSYVPQAGAEPPPFAVREFVMMARYPHWSPFSTVSEVDHDAVEHALTLTGTAPWRERPLSTLSGGERQMVYIAAALAQQADILVLDEPAAFLDYRHQVDIFNLLRRLNVDEGRSILSVSHNVNAAARVSHRLLALKDGRAILEDTPERVLHAETLRTVFDTEFRLVHEPGTALPLVVTEQGA